MQCMWRNLAAKFLTSEKNRHLGVNFETNSIDQVGTQAIESKTCVIWNGNKFWYGQKDNSI